MMRNWISKLCAFLCDSGPAVGGGGLSGAAALFSPSDDRFKVKSLFFFLEILLKSH